MSTLSPVTLYSKPACVQCVGTERYLKNLDIPYEKIDISQDEAAYNLVAGLGYQQVPVVVVPDTYEIMGGEHWSGLQPDNLKRLAENNVVC